MTRILGPRGSRRRRRMLLPSILLIAAAMVLIVARAGAANQGGFEIDAGVDNATHSQALYSGTLPTPGDDWAPGSSQQGVFSATGSTPAVPGGTGCYGSNIFLGGAVSAASSAFICDGNSDPKLKAFPEKNIVSPSGKTPDASWPIKPGNVRPKNDFSHAYVYTKTAHSPCNTADPNSQDPILYLGGHVGDNEGDHFWGWEFDKIAPTNFNQLKNNSGDTFNLVFNRSVGDILVSVTVPGSAGALPELEIFKVTGFNADGSAIFTPAGAQAICPPSAPQGLSEVETNNVNDVLAPPWNVPVCDPTSEDGSNGCRLANGTNVAPNDKLLAQRDFAEASVDLFAFGIDPCFSNVIFTSRSAHPLEGADVQDVGGADIPLCGKKTGQKFEDLNGNGVKDSGEPGLNGWPINLYRDAGTIGTLDAADDNDPGTPGIQPFKTTTTSTINSVIGSYSFDTLQNGKYIVCEAQNPPAASGLPTSGWNESLPSASSTPPTGETNANCSADGTLSGVGYAFTMSGQTQTGNDFGNFIQGTKSGTKFKDVNANGTRDLPDDVGLSGWTIRAYADTNGDGTLQAGETTIAASTNTDASGNYTLSLNPGKYVVCEALQATWFQSAPSNSKCSAINPGAGVGAGGFAVTITSRSTETGNLFGNFQQGTKSGTKFNDLNANGVRDLPGEIGRASCRDRAYSETNGDGTLQAGSTTIDGATISDESGHYTLTLNPGKYVVCEVLQATWFQSAPSNTKCAAINPTAGVGNGGFAVTITSGSTETGNLFGNFQQGTKSGTKFKDLNANGVRDLPGDVGLSGWTIRAYFDPNGDGTLQDTETTIAASASTNASGAYTLTLDPGKYVVCEVLQATWFQSAPSNTKCSAINPAAGVGNGGFAVTIT